LTDAKAHRLLNPTLHALPHRQRQMDGHTRRKTDRLTDKLTDQSIGLWHWKQTDSRCKDAESHRHAARI